MIALALMLGAASAQELPFDVEVPDLGSQLFRNSIDANYTLWTDDSGLVQKERKVRWGARGAVSYVNDPFVIYWQSAEVQDGRTELVSDALQLDVLGSVQYDRVRLGIDLPVYLFSAGRLTDNGAGLGDVNLDLRGTLLDRREQPVGLALSARTNLPTTTVQAPLGVTSGKTQLELGAIVDQRFGRTLLAANLGHRFVPRQELVNVTWDDQLFFRTGVGHELTENNGLSADLAGSFTYASIRRATDQEPSRGAGNPLEALLGGWQRVDGDWFLQGGVGTGLTRGIGAPVFRAVLTVAYKPPIDEQSKVLVSQDADGDGFLDAEDACPGGAEDVDGYQDGDGCPDPSRPLVVRVSDPLGNLIDVALTELSDGETVQLEGAPGQQVELHPTAAGYALKVSAAGFHPVSQPVMLDMTGEGPQVVEVVLQPVIPPGVVEVVVLDRDRNPVPDAVVRLRGDPESEKTGGSASYELEPGTYVAAARAPHFKRAISEVTVVSDQTTRVTLLLDPAKAELEGGRITIRDSVYFATGRAEIKPESFELLDEVAQIMLEHPEILVLRIEGHTDSRGSASSNKALSQKRAASVQRYLQDRGIQADRLTSVGFGEEKPLDPREVAEAWEKNRRVDFFVEKHADDQ